MRYKDVELIPRKHVIPEYGVIIREQGDEWKQGYDYRNTPLSDWVIEAGKPKDLGLFLKAAHQAIPKRTCWLLGSVRRNIRYAHQNCQVNGPRS